MTAAVIISRLKATEKTNNLACRSLPNTSVFPWHCRSAFFSKRMKDSKHNGSPERRRRRRKREQRASGGKGAVFQGLVIKPIVVLLLASIGLLCAALTNPPQQRKVKMLIRVKCK